MKEGDLVLCKVEDVTNTVTTVLLPDGRRGTIISSEIAPGRIKFMRHYVVPNKQIVCKVLSVLGNGVQLSLRRVTSKEKKEVFMKYKQEHAINLAFKQILGEGSKESEKILEVFGSFDKFVDEARVKREIISEYISKDKLDQFLKIIDKKKKGVEVRYGLEVKCLQDDGVSRIKKLLKFDDDKISVNYVSAGKFKLRLKVEDFKQGKKEIVEILDNLSKKSKDLDCEFSYLEEK